MFCISVLFESVGLPFLEIVPYGFISSALACLSHDAIAREMALYQWIPAMQSPIRLDAHKKNFPPRLGSGSSLCPRASFIPTRLCLGLVTVTYRVTMRSNLVSCCFYSLIVNSTLYSLLRFFRSFIRSFLDCFVYWNRNIIACSRRAVEW